MEFTIEFCRIRESDDAHAVVGRETVRAADVDAAVEAARQLGRTLDMPQLPDAIRIKDRRGAVLFAGPLCVP
jgi:hypothetical protein